MLKIMYLVIPFALDAIITFILSRLKVEKQTNSFVQQWIIESSSCPLDP